ncbi:MAG: IS66 family insertion sequence element accessory protein TnpB [Beijerinckiaceae bacterium]
MTDGAIFDGVAFLGEGAETRVFVSTAPVDFRKGVHGLIAPVPEGLKGNPYCGDVFVFRSKRQDRLKILVFDGTGVNAGELLQRLAGAKVQQGCKQKGPRYRWPFCLSRFFLGGGAWWWLVRDDGLDLCLA